MLSSIVLPQHDQNARPDQQPQQPRPPGENAAPGTRFGHADAIMRTVDIFVGNDTTSVFAVNARCSEGLQTYACGPTGSCKYTARSKL